jgi:hypothetical protein
MAGHVPATGRDGLSLRMGRTCPTGTVGQPAVGIFTLSWCPARCPATALIGSHRPSATHDCDPKVLALFAVAG